MRSGAGWADLIGIVETTAGQRGDGDKMKKPSGRCRGLVESLGGCAF